MISPKVILKLQRFCEYHFTHTPTDVHVTLLTQLFQNFHAFVKKLGDETVDWNQCSIYHLHIKQVTFEFVQVALPLSTRDKYHDLSCCHYHYGPLKMSLILVLVTRTKATCPCAGIWFGL